MKKITLLIASLAFTLFSSCNMDLDPYNKIPEDGGIRDATDCGSYIDGIYATFRLLTTGDFVVYGDVQTDCFHAVEGNGGALNQLYSGILQSQMDEFATIWHGYYSVIGSANYIIREIERLQATDLDETSQNELKNYMGDALVFRAYCFYNLALYFCEAYDAATAENAHSGIPLQLTYRPNANSSTYLTRSTLQEVYDQILADLKKGEELIMEYGPNPDDGSWAEAPWFTVYTVRALKARVALSMKDYQTAFDTSKAIISTRNYPLVKTAEALKNMWLWDTSSEIILLVDMTWQYKGYATGSYFLANNGNPLFIPTAEYAAQYEARADKRDTIYLTNNDLKVGGFEYKNMQVFNKYPGNMNLMTTVNDFTNMSKPFHIAEQYLIAAESAAELGNEANANEYLNTLLASRISNYTSQNLTGDELIQTIRKERHSELYGEGFRLPDLKRWGVGFQRSAAQNVNTVNQLGNIHRLSYEADDYRFVWPIPKAEMDINLNMKGQQNRGY